MSSARNDTSRASRRRGAITAVLVAVVAMGALSGSFVTSAASAPRDDEERALERDGERALEVSRAGVRDQVDTPVD
ncbi:MAG: hypothetical protein ACKOA9_11035, partial [Actinomycetota bacterium]